MRSLHMPQLPSTLAMKVFVCAEKLENRNMERNKIPDFMIVFIFLKIKNGKIIVYLVCIYMEACLVVVKH